jgi:hypothetical protein
VHTTHRGIAVSVDTAIGPRSPRDGMPGPLTKRLRERYFEVVRGLVPDHAEWRTAV